MEIQIDRITRDDDIRSKENILIIGKNGKFIGIINKDTKKIINIVIQI